MVQAQFMITKHRMVLVPGVVMEESDLKQFKGMLAEMFTLQKVVNLQVLEQMVTRHLLELVQLPI